MLASETRWNLVARTKLAALYNMEHGTSETFAPTVLEMARARLHARASCSIGRSLDGRIIAEFKFMSKPVTDQKKELTEGQKKHVAVLKGEIPENYWIQVQHALHRVSGAEKCIFGSFDGETLHTCEILPDTEFMKLHLEACSAFWNFVLAKKAPPLTGEDYKELRVKGAKGKIQKWKRLKKLADDTETQMEEIRAEILALAEQEKHPRLSCDGVRIVKYPGNAGSTDWKAAFIASKSSLDPNKFKKADGKPFWKMEIEK